ncbi:unknown; predicted coding region [Mycoplasmopsis pulmonis]|uniref:Uncharacterized protein n=1 Tax=Mycoplasmopsis pulmonis (strain UAB CTIP) TaxID=272635 RepID=Q98RA8_MYCPU|nr:unknown; predicted coding region [Mycoplasmopsis pulmonis]
MKPIHFPSKINCSLNQSVKESKNPKIIGIIKTIEKIIIAGKTITQKVFLLYILALSY